VTSRSDFGDTSRKDFGDIAFLTQKWLPSGCHFGDTARRHFGIPSISLFGDTFYTLEDGFMISVRSLQRSDSLRCNLLTEINIPSARV